jgi:hypothetical protein
MAREQLDVITVIFNNASYAVLNMELNRVGATASVGTQGPHGRDARPRRHRPHIGDRRLDHVRTGRVRRRQTTNDTARPVSTTPPSTGTHGGEPDELASN